MSINLANVNISLQQFQAVSNGKYNAGEVRLASETTLEKINNRVHFTGANRTTLTHAEVLAVKQAFVKALGQGGVGEEELSRIRRDLGLGSGGAVDTSLRDRSIKPLSRQQVREILDRNAAAINAHAQTIRTSEEIYSGVDAQTRASRAAVREAVNAGLDGTRAVEGHHRIALFQALVAGDVDFHSREDRAALLAMARDALDIILRQSDGHPREGVPAKIAWGVGDEKRLSMETGLDEATFARKLEDIIARLPRFPPSEDAINLRAELRALPRESRSAWIDALPQSGGQVPWKTRTAVIALLQDAGIADYESLDLVNRLPDEVATTLLRNLAALPEGASEQDTRACLDTVRSMAGERVPVPAHMPATSVKEFNDEVAQYFTSSPERCCGAYKTLAAELLEEARAVFGADVVRGTTKINELLDIGVVTRTIRALGGDVRATPEVLREGFRRELFMQAAEKSIRRYVAARADALGISLNNPMVVGNALRAALPDLAGRLAACANAGEVAAALNDVRDRVDAEVRRIAENERCRAAFADMARAALSAKIGVPASALAEPVLSRSRLTALSVRLADKITLRKIHAETAEEIEQAFRAEAERFAAERADILEKAERLPLSAAARAELKVWLLAQDKVDYLDLDAILAEAAKVDLAALAGVLRAGAPKEQVYAAMKSFADAIRPIARALLQGKDDEIGSPETTNVSTILIIAALDRYPGIRTDLAAFLARPEVVDEGNNRFNPEHPSYSSSVLMTFGLPSAAEAKAAFLEKVAAGAPTPVQAQALYRAVRAEGLDLSPEEVVAVFANGTPLAETFGQIVGGYEGEITPEALELLARGALRRHNEQGRILEMVETVRTATLKKVETGNFSALPERYRSAADAPLAALRRKFGEERVPQGARFTGVADLTALQLKLRPLVNAARNERRLVTLEEFRKAAQEATEEALLLKTVCGEMTAIAAGLGFPKTTIGLARDFLANNPAIAASLRAAKDPQGIRAALDGIRETIRAAVVQENELATLVRACPDLMAEKLARRLHISKEEAREFGYDRTLTSSLEELKVAIRRGTHPGCREDGFSVPMAFDKLVDDFVVSYLDRFAAIDRLEGVSPETKKALKEVARRENRPDKPFVDAARAQRIAAKVDGAALLAALGDANATDEVRLAAIARYADQIEAAVKEEFRDLLQNGRLGVDELIPVVANVRAFAIGATPGLKEALDRLSADPFAQRAPVAFMQGEHLDHPLRASVASALF